MQIGPIALKLRLAETRFENRIFGAAELALVQEYSLKAESAFVVQLSESVNTNTLDNDINQKINERFAVIVALDNGTSDRDKVGFIAYDKLFDIRAEIFKAILGWQMPGAESLVSYGGARILGLNRAYLFYQFEFVVDVRIDVDDGVDVGTDDLPPFDTLYAQWVLAPSVNATAVEGVTALPVTIIDPDMTTVIDFTSNPAVDGAFGSGFGFTWYQTFKK